MSVLTIIYTVLIGLGTLFSILRIIIGPGFFNRIAALDTFNMIIIAVLLLISLNFKQSFYLDIAILYSLLSFAESIVFAKIGQNIHSKSNKIKD